MVSILAEGDTGFFTEDTVIKLGVAVIAAILGFLFAYILDLIKKKREPVKQISYELELGSNVTTVPESLAEKIQITFEDRPIDGQLFEVSCVIVNTGNQVIKNQFLRFNFPSPARVLDTFSTGDIPDEWGVTEVAIDVPKDTDRRWCVKQLERGEAFAVGLLVVSTAPTLPKVIPHNDEGNVELVTRAQLAVRDDASHIVPFITLLFLNLFLPIVIAPVFDFLGEFANFLGDFWLTLLRLVLFILLLRHVTPIGRLIRSRLLRAQHPQSSKVTVKADSVSGVLVVGTGTSGGTSVVQHSPLDED